MAAPCWRLTRVSSLLSLPPLPSGQRLGRYACQALGNRHCPDPCRVQSSSRWCLCLSECPRRQCAAWPARARAFPLACASSWRSMCSSRECRATRHFGRMDWSCSQSPAYVFTVLQSYELGHPAHFSCASMSMCMPWAACWWHTSNATRRHAYGAHAQPQSGHSTRGACRWRQFHWAGGTTGMDGYTSLRQARQS